MGRVSFVNDVEKPLYHGQGRERREGKKLFEEKFKKKSRNLTQYLPTQLPGHEGCTTPNDPRHEDNMVKQYMEEKEKIKREVLKYLPIFVLGS